MLGLDWILRSASNCYTYIKAGNDTVLLLSSSSSSSPLLLVIIDGRKIQHPDSSGRIGRSKIPQPQEVRLFWLMDGGSVSQRFLEDGLTLPSSPRRTQKWREEAGSGEYKRASRMLWSVAASNIRTTSRTAIAPAITVTTILSSVRAATRT